MDLRWWSVESNLLVGLPLGLLQPDLLLFADTSDTGWGASLEDAHLSGLWPPACSQYSINHRKLLVVLYAVQGFLPLLKGCSISLFSNNAMALSYLRNQGGTHSSTQCGGAGHSKALRVPQSSSSSSVYFQSTECSCGLS